MRLKRTIMMLCPALLLAGCSGDPHDVDLGAELNRVSVGGDTVTVTVGGIFGTKWKEAVAICPESTKEEISRTLGVENPPTADPGRAIIGLKDSEGWAAWPSYSLDYIDLCSEVDDLQPVTEDQLLEFEHLATGWRLIGLSKNH